MSTFQNVTDEDLNLSIDGVTFLVKAGDSFTIPDDYDYQLVEQPYYKLLTAKDAKSVDPIVPHIDPITPLSDPVAATPAEAPASTEGTN